jgi:transketolase
LIVTVENQSVIGGLGGAVSEALGEAYPTKIIRLGLQDHFGETAKLRYMMHKYGIDAENIVSVILGALVK